MVPFTFTANAKVEIPQRTNGVTVVNTGNSVLIVQGIPLAPPVAPAQLGEAYSFGGNRGEIFHGRLDINFQNATGTGRCVVMFKEYLEFKHGGPFEL